jgi:CubicO group peptidase (beta-lactamase class C family)
VLKSTIEPGAESTSHLHKNFISLKYYRAHVLPVFQFPVQDKEMFVLTKSLVLLFVLLCSVSNTSAQGVEAGKLADDIRGKRVSAFVKLVNSTDDETLREFVSKEMAPNPDIPFEERINRFRKLRENVGPATLRRVLDVERAETNFLLETKKGEWLKVRLVFDHDSQNQISGLEIKHTDASAMQSSAAPPAKISESELGRTIENYLSGLLKSDEFSGVVLVAKNGSPIFTRAYGLASKEFDVPNRADTKFNLGSLNKLFTTIAIGQLADAGKLSFGDPIAKYLPDFPNRQAAEKITIKHLLTMSSGIRDFFGEKYEAMSKDKLRSLKDFLPLFASESLAFEPGTKRQYSNGGFIVLGLIVEKASGENYFDYVRERIFKVAGMDNTDHYDADAVVSNLAMGYSHNLGPGSGLAAGSGARRNNIFSRPVRGSSAGGGYSTVEDMLKFANALDSKKLPIPASLTSNGAEIPGGGLANGIGAAGGAPGLNAEFDTKVAGAYTIVVMSNYDPPAAEKVAKQIRRWLTGKTD